MRVATGTICHETSTFTPVATTWESYRERFGYRRGEEILEIFSATNTPTGGFIEGARAHGFELIPTIFAEPQPSGPTPRDIFDEILEEMLSGIRSAGAIDGVLLQLHGAMVAEGVDDGEGHILEAVREVVGADVPVVGQLDIHSNISHRMVEMADVLIGRETYPEVDMAERGRECADVLVRIVEEGLRPTMALHQIDMVWGMNQVTAHPPMREAIAELHRIESEAGVICGSIATCFPLADIPDMGASVYIVTDGDDTFTLSNRDFNVRSFRSNVVLRWEWRPGSTLFVVWQQNRASRTDEGSHVGIGDLFGSFSAAGDNIFAIKTTLWTSR